MRTSERTGKLMLAIRRVQAALPLVAKTATVKITGGGESRTEKHAPHDEIWDQLRPHCEANGLTVTQDGSSGPNGSQWLTTRITWVSDDGSEEQWKDGDVQVASPRPGFRDFGAFWSYARRIALLAAFGIVAGGDEPDQQEAAKAQEAKPPRADKGARPSGAPRDPEAEAARILRELQDLPPGSTAAQVGALSRQLSGLQFDPATHKKVGEKFAEKRKELGLA